MKKFIKIIGVLSLVITMGIGFYVFRVYYIKKFGITIKPSEVISKYDIPYYLQNDPIWGDSTLGNTEENLRATGCLVSSLASGITLLNDTINPSQLNIKLRENGAFTSSGYVIWNKIKSINPNIDYSFKRFFTSSDIDNDLKSGHFPIVKVKYYGNGIFHWVSIIGSSKDDYWIMDPLEASQKAIKLSTHGKVYAYRKIFNSGLN